MYYFLGHHCQLGVAAPTKCMEGTYMPYGVDLSGTLQGPGMCFMHYVMNCIV